MHSIEEINKRLSETEEEHIAYIIRYELEEEDMVYLDDDKEDEIKQIIENFKKKINKYDGYNNYLSEEENAFLSKIISDNIIEDIICFNGDEYSIFKKIYSIVKRMETIYFQYRDYWLEKEHEYRKWELVFQN